MKLLKEFFWFIKERDAVRLKKENGQPKPWTRDPILQSYRFCNIRREDDAVTIWIRKNWREPFKRDPNVWFAMTVARFVNWPDSLYALSVAKALFTGHAKPISAERARVAWRPEKFVATMDAVKGKSWSAAYMINAVGGEGRTKAAYIAESVLTPIWKDRTDGQVAFETSLGTAYAWLSQFRGMGSFMAAQVVADVKYTPMLAGARDWWTFAAPGPGSMRGLSVVEFGDLGTSYTEVEWRTSLAELKAKIDPMLAQASLPLLHAQDLQNCLCEYSKWKRGYGRQKYPGSTECK